MRRKYFALCPLPCLWPEKRSHGRSRVSASPCFASNPNFVHLFMPSGADMQYPSSLAHSIEGSGYFVRPVILVRLIIAVHNRSTRRPRDQSFYTCPCTRRSSSQLVPQTPSFESYKLTAGEGIRMCWHHPSLRHKYAGCVSCASKICPPSQRHHVGKRVMHVYKGRQEGGMSDENDQPFPRTRHR